jgi:hypothetical protein
MRNFAPKVDAEIFPAGFARFCFTVYQTELPAAIKGEGR